MAPFLTADCKAHSRFRFHRMRNGNTADHSDRWCGLYPGQHFIALVIEGNIASYDRDPDLPGHIPHAADTLGKLPIDISVDRACKIQAVYNTEWIGSNASKICRILVYRIRRTFAWGQIYLSWVTPAREGKAPRLSLKPVP